MSKELFPGGTYDVIDKAVEKIEANPQVTQMLGGLPLRVYGHTGNRGRRRPIVQESFLPDGSKALESSFFVEGPGGVRGQVSLQMQETEEGGWRERYLAVEIAGFPTQILAQPPAQSLKPLNRPTWSPFSRFFS